MFDQALYDRLKDESLAYWKEVCNRASLYSSGKRRGQTPLMALQSTLSTAAEIAVGKGILI